MLTSDTKGFYSNSWCVSCYLSFLVTVGQSHTLTLEYGYLAHVTLTLQMENKQRIAFDAAFNLIWLKQKEV